MTHAYYYYMTPVGEITVVENGRAITGISYGHHTFPNAKQMQTTLLKKAGEQLSEYFSGQRFEFDLPFEFESGSPFEQKVWSALFEIPYGQTRTYGDIAQSIKHSKSCRAVGRANKYNPIMVCCPCHRVIGSQGHLMGYAGGLERKKHLLALERRFKCSSHF